MRLKATGNREGSTAFGERILLSSNMSQIIGGRCINNFSSGLNVFRKLIWELTNGFSVFIPFALKIIKVQP